MSSLCFQFSSNPCLIPNTYGFKVHSRSSFHPCLCSIHPFKSSFTPSFHHKPIQFDTQNRSTSSSTITCLYGPGGGFFGVGSFEVVVIVLVGIVVLGPKDFIQFTKSAGSFIATVTSTLNKVRIDLIDRFELNELSNTFNEIKNNEPNRQENIENSGKSGNHDVIEDWGVVVDNQRQQLDQLEQLEREYNEKKQKILLNQLEQDYLKLKSRLNQSDINSSKG